MTEPNNSNRDEIPEPDNSKKIGKGMYFAAWIAGFLLLVVFFNDKLAQQENPNRSPSSGYNESGVAEVVLQRNRYGHYVTTGYINGVQVKFLLDTGATNVSIPEPIAQKIGLQYGYERPVNTANGRAIVYQTQIDSLEIGVIKLRNLTGNINPNMDSEEILLGMSALKRLEFTQRGDTLTLRL